MSHRGDLLDPVKRSVRPLKYVPGVILAKRDHVILRPILESWTASELDSWLTSFA